MRKAEFDPAALDDLRWWVEHDRKMAIRIFRLIQAMLRTPFVGSGKPEPLRYELKGTWSRRFLFSSTFCPLFVSRQYVRRRLVSARRQNSQRHRTRSALRQLESQSSLTYEVLSRGPSNKTGSCPGKNGDVNRF
ncbi:MAG TPA: Txe/YoeB family addiction module toxin [Thermomicrobiales bacterium]|nr:Txe/YoeB family addiction module toxin [Thermomicrobiales bacterium]